MARSGKYSRKKNSRGFLRSGFAWWSTKGTSTFTERKATAKLFVRACGGDRPRLRILGGPIFRGERHAPERRARLAKFQANLRFTGAHRAKENHLAFLLFLSAFVLHQNFVSADDARFHQDQGAVRINSEGVGFFLE